MNTLTSILLARLVTQIEMAQLHLRADNVERAQEHLAEAEKIATQIREGRS